MPGSNTYSMLSAQPASQGRSTADGGGSALSSGSAPVSTSSGSILSSFGDVLGYIANPIGSLINFFANRSLSDRRNQQAVEQWMRENEYNLPKNQIQRLRAAGLNPALMYENGASGLVSANSPDITMPAPSSLSVFDPLTAAEISKINAETEAIKDSNFRANELQPFNVQNLEANNRVLSQQVKNLSAQEQDIFMQWMFKNVEQSISRDVADSQIALWNSQKGINEELKLKTAEEYRQLCALYQLREQGIMLSNSEIAAKIKVDNATAEKLNAQVQYLSDMSLAALTNAKVNKERFDKLGEFEKNLLSWQATNQQQQANYWYNYTRYPSYYRSKSASVSVLGSGASLKN